MKKLNFKLLKILAFSTAVLTAGSLVDVDEALARKRSGKSNASPKKSEEKKKKKVVKDPKKLEEGDKYFEARKYEKALKAYTAYVEGFPKKYEGYFKRALTWIILRNNGPAFLDMNKAITLEKDKPELWFERGRLQVARGEFESAIKDLDIAVKKGSKETLQIHKLKQESFFNTQNLKSQIDELGKIIEIEPRLTWYKKRAEAYYILKNYEKAIEDYSKAIEKNPKSEGLLLRRGYCYEKTEQWQKAIEDYSTIIDDDPRAYRVFERRATVYFALNDMNNALADVSKAIFHFRGYNPKDLYLMRGKIYKNLGQNDKAAKDFAQYAKEKKLH